MAAPCYDAHAGSRESSARRCASGLERPDRGCFGSHGGGRACAVETLVGCDSARHRFVRLEGRGPRCSTCPRTAPVQALEGTRAQPLCGNCSTSCSPIGVLARSRVVFCVVLQTLVSTLRSGGLFLDAASLSSKPDINLRINSGCAPSNWLVWRTRQRRAGPNHGFCLSISRIPLLRLHPSRLTHVDRVTRSTR
jgi:hypothetical protein